MRFPSAKVGREAWQAGKSGAGAATSDFGNVSAGISAFDPLRKFGSKFSMMGFDLTRTSAPYAVL
jgi:hypothetical protein